MIQYHRTYYAKSIRSACPHVVVYVNLVGHQQARGALAVLPELPVPIRQVLVRRLPRHVKN